MSVMLPCSGAINENAVQTAACPASLQCRRRPLKHLTCRHSRPRLSLHTSHSFTVEALQVEKGKPATQSKRSGRKAKKEKDSRLEPLSPASYQQTIRKAFTIGGLGLHTGAYAYIQVRPAYANEGRYFVRVPEGTNCHLFQMDEDVEHDIEGDLSHDRPQTEAEDALQVELYYKFLHARTLGYSGLFDQFVKEQIAQPVIDSMLPEEEEPDEEIVPRGEDEITVDAALASVRSMPHADLLTTLGSGENSVSGVEHLLSALEGCGIDNARIEIEGGHEVPIIDGSALGWTLALQSAGAAQAKAQGSDPTNSGERIRKQARKVASPGETVTVRRDDAFITFFPEGTQRLTYGIDYSAECQIIGKQWFTWAPSEDGAYRWEVAPARTFATSVQDVFQMRQRGLVKGGTEGCAIIGFGDRWREPDKVRFFDDEPVRHKMLDLIGDLSLLAAKGHAGIPQGHIIAYKADHALHIEFAQALQASYA